ncbi:PepSY domain-containing protein [Streptomyces sp. NPDC056159]|uniref:PepSY domain-containing protein n=1 Tax=Streptomyces sp. NPDC056159 TaxID=3155537 RepID=UPI00342EC929
MKALKRSLAGRRRTVAAVVAATVVLGGVGAASAIAFADDDSTYTTVVPTAGTHDDDGDHDRSGTHDDSDHDGTLAASAKVGLKQAVDAATKSVAGTVTEVELDGRRGKVVWEVDIVDAKGVEHEVTVNAADGKTIVGKADHDEGADHRGDAALAKSARTGLGQAVDTALDKVPGTATSAELDDHHGKTAAWHVHVTDDRGAAHEVTVDAQTGKVTATHTAQAHSGSKDRDDNREDD